jgi:hypothetical protein
MFLIFLKELMQSQRCIQSHFIILMQSPWAMGRHKSVGVLLWAVSHRAWGPPPNDWRFSKRWCHDVHSLESSDAKDDIISNTWFNALGSRQETQSKGRIGGLDKKIQHHYCTITGSDDYFELSRLRPPLQHVFLITARIGQTDWRSNDHEDESSF